MPSILFVCTANQFRSPLSAAMLLKLAQLRDDLSSWTIESAGTWTTDGMPGLVLTQKIGASLGLSGLDKHITRQVSAELLRGYDLIIVMEANHKEALCVEFKSAQPRIFMLSEAIEGIQYDIPDPVVPGIRPDDVAIELSTLMNKGANKIFNLAWKIHSSR